ncbi:F-box protein GID2 [Tripterygium wilfordii]|uniref:F-box protein GID2 n=1 Tax=Tripterygium wilfordii TaxID=458696 RepID=A0A7J7D2R6_TRIWF|nr:F-box protein GID2 [Tripterygium wilfordii]
MKRTLTCGEFPGTRDEGTKKMKMIEQDDDGDDDEEGVNKETGFVHFDENLLFEVFKHVDARTLGRAAGVVKSENMRSVEVMRAEEAIAVDRASFSVENCLCCSNLTFDYFSTSNNPS